MNRFSRRYRRRNKHDLFRKAAHVHEHVHVNVNVNDNVYVDVEVDVHVLVDAGGFCSMLMIQNERETMHRGYTFL